MSVFHVWRIAPPWLSAAALLFALFMFSCGDSSGVGKTLPVRGKITLDDAPVTAESTVILFKPDASKGNTSPFEPVGGVDQEGNYTVATKGKRGAPPGWYKVIVTATESGMEKPKDPKKGHPHPRSLIAAKYGQAKTTDLTVQVVEDPAAGAYDLKLKK